MVFFGLPSEWNPCEDCCNKIGSPLDPCDTCNKWNNWQHFEKIPGEPLIKSLWEN